MNLASHSCFKDVSLYYTPCISIRQAKCLLLQIPVKSKLIFLCFVDLFLKKIKLFMRWHNSKSMLNCLTTDTFEYYLLGSIAQAHQTW